MKLLVIEDDPSVRELLETGLRGQGFAVDVAATGAAGEEQAARPGYDLIILDVMLPDRDGTEVCRNLRRAGISTPVLMLTALGATDAKIDGLDSGADDYLTKPYEITELIARIRAILRRGPRPGEPAESHTLRHSGLELELYSRRASRDGKRIDLSNKEFRLLELLMRNPNRVLSRAQIGERVWDGGFDPNSNVIDVYIAMLRKQVDRDFERPLIHTVKGAGYRFGDRE